MMLSILQGVLIPISFGSLFSLMLFYWGQAALFSYTKYSKLTTVLFSFSFISLTTLLLLRWVDSGHFPLSNLYESLLFLSWSFLGIQLIAQLSLFSAASTVELDSLSLKCATLTVADLEKPKPERVFISSQQQLLHLLGVITSPMALLTYGFAFLTLPREMQKATALVPALQSNWLMMHVTIMILSYAALICGCIFSMAFLILTNLKTSSQSLEIAYKPALTNDNSSLNQPPVGVSSRMREDSRSNLSSFSGRETKFYFSKTSNEEGYANSSSNQPPVSDANSISANSSKARVRGQARVTACGSNVLHPNPSKGVGKADRSIFWGSAQSFCTCSDHAVPFDKVKSFQSNGVRKNQLFTKPKGGLLRQNLAKQETRSLPKVEQVLDSRFGRCVNANLGQVGNTLSIDTKSASRPITSDLSLAERLDNYSYRVLALGFPLLTVGILSGAVWANEAWGSYWSWDPKETWALITWLLFAIYLHARILKGWTGRKPAIIATFGFFVVWFCYLGVNLLGTGLHSYGWFSN